MEKSTRLMVVPAHNGDEVVMCGGWMSKLTREKQQQVVVSITNQDAEQQVKVAQHFGALSCQCLKQREDFNESMIKLIHDYRPQYIVTNHPKDFTTDHAWVGQRMREIVFEAPRRAQQNGIKDFKKPILLFARPYQHPYYTKGQVFVEISVADLASKLQACRLYDWTPDLPGNPIYDIIHDTSWIPRYGEVCGSVVGKQFAEIYTMDNLEPSLELWSNI